MIFCTGIVDWGRGTVGGGLCYGFLRGGTRWRGPAYLVAVGALVALRIGAEERMMLETFGGEYEAYMSRSRRLVPGIW